MRRNEFRMLMRGFGIEQFELAMVNFFSGTEIRACQPAHSAVFALEAVSPLPYPNLSSISSPRRARVRGRLEFVVRGPAYRFVACCPGAHSHHHEGRKRNSCGI